MRTLTALSFAAALGLTGLVGAQATTADASAQAANGQATIGPKIRVVPEEIDFGQIDDSKVVEKSVVITNVGDDLLRIPQEEGVKGSCGCTIPTLAKYELEPGESVAMTVRFDPRNRQGNQRKTVSIQSEGSNSQTTLPVNAFVIQRVLVVEGFARFGNVDQGDEATIEVHVRGMSPDFEVTEAIASRDDMYETKILGTELVERADPVTGEVTMVGETKIQVTLKSDAPIGRTDGKITIRTNDPVATEKEIRTVASVAGDVRLDPAVIRLGALESGASFEQTLTVFSNKSRSFNIERVLFVTSDLSDADKALITTSHEPLASDDGQVGHTVTFKGDVSDSMRIIRGKLVIVTDAPGQRVISANVSGVVRSR